MTIQTILSTSTFQARGRTCEADHNLMDSPNVGKTRFTMHLPEKIYEGCSCATDITSKQSKLPSCKDFFPAENTAITQCQTTAHIASTQNLCTFQLATCNTGKTCPKMVDYTVEKDCPQCGKPGHVKVSKLSCSGLVQADFGFFVTHFRPDTGVPTTDWESTAAYTDDDCIAAGVFDKPVRQYEGMLQFQFLVLCFSLCYH